MAISSRILSGRLTFRCCCCCFASVPLIDLSACWRWVCCGANVALHDQLAQRLVDDFDNRGVFLVGTVADLPRVDSDRVSLQLDEVNIDTYPAAMPRRVSLNWYQSKQLPMAGERWQFLVRLRQPRGQLNPAGFDYEAWQFVQGIDARGYVLDSKLNQRLSPASPVSISGLRQRLAANIERDCEACRHSGLIKALAVGFRGDIDPSSRQLLQSTGTAHLLAISGLHIAMVAFLLFGAGRYIWRLWVVYSYWYQSARNGLPVCAGRGDCLRGHGRFQPADPARADHAGGRVDRSATPQQDQFAAIDFAGPGRGIDFRSTGGGICILLVEFWRPVDHSLCAIPPARRMSGWRQLLVLQFYFTLLFAPLGVFIFGQINISALPANLVAIPLLSLLILPLVLTACLLSTVWSAGASLAIQPGRSTAWISCSIILTFCWRQACARALSMTIQRCCCCLHCAQSCCCYCQRLRALGVVALAMMVVVLCWQPARLKPGEFELLVLDVGMGSSLLLRTSHHSLVYDFGPGRNDRFNAARRALLPVMQRLGIDEADLLVVSHVDQDHSGGLHSFIGNYRPTQLLSGTPRELHARFALQHRVRSCHDYPDWRWDGVSFSFLDATDDSVKRTTNDRSCILLVSGHHRVLLPGDIEALQESRLVESFGEELRADVLLAPHHGSGTSSSQAFIDRVKPSEVVFTLSRKNRWGFPDEAVISRYRAINARLHRSDQDGAIRFYSKAGALRVTSLRRPPQRSWRRW